MKILTLKKKLKKRGGYIFITTVTVMMVVISNLFINFIAIQRGGQRVKNLIETSEIERKRENLETLVYHEIRKIDEKVRKKEYRDGAEYIGLTEGGKKIWFSNEEKTKSGYKIVSMRSNGKNRFYLHKQGSSKNLETVIQRELYSLSQEINYIGIELKKMIVERELEKTGEKIYIKCQVDLVYEKGNKVAKYPDREVLREVEVGIKN